MFKRTIVLLLLGAPVLAQQPAAQPNSIPATTANTKGVAPANGTDPVQNELDQNSLKLKMPMGATSASFDLSDSARQAMIPSRAVLRVSDQIQLTKQDSVTMRGLMNLPIASLSEVVSKMDYYAQIRFIRYGLLEISDHPDQARLFAAKLYILTDEIIPRKAILDSLNTQKAIEETQFQAQKQKQEQKLPALETAPAKPDTSTGWLWPLLLSILLAGGGYYWFFVRPKPAKPVSAPPVGKMDDLSIESVHSLATSSDGHLPESSLTPVSHQTNADDSPQDSDQPEIKAL